MSSVWIVDQCPILLSLTMQAHPKGANSGQLLAVSIKSMKSTVEICHIKFESVTDIAFDSPWMDVLDKTGGKECNYWVHSICKGFADASEEDIERLNFHCPDHNKRTKYTRHTITG